MITENKVVPKLRFREFDDSWIKESLRNCTIKIGSGSTPRGGDKTYTKDGEVHFIRSQNVFNNELVLTGDVFISDEINSKMKGSIVKPSDVLLNITGGSIGRSCVVPHEFSKGNVNQHVCIIRLDNQVYPYFLQPFLASQRGQKLIKRGQTGSGREGLNFQSIALFKLNLPSVEEQKKISKFLRAIDKKLQQLSKKKELLEDYKKGIIQKIFSQEIRFKDDSGNNYPDWQEKKLGQIGKTFNGLTGKTKKDFGNGKPFIQYMQVFSSAKIDKSKFGFVNLKENEKQNKVRYGDVFFTTSSETPLEIGYASVLTEEVEELYLNSFCFGFRANSLNELYPDFSSYLFRSQSLRKQIIKLAQGSTRYNMSKVQLLKTLVILPSLKEQQKIAHFLNSIDKKIESVSHQLKKTKEFKKGLLQQMFV